MKPAVSLLLSLLLALLCACGLCQEIEEEEIDPYAHLTFPLAAVVVNPNPEERLNLRSKADTGSTSLAKFYTGVEVDVFSIMDGWAKVTAGGGLMEGYMLMDYLELSTKEVRIQPAMPRVTVTQPGGKKLYNKLDGGASVLGRLETGMQTTVLAVTPDNWLFVLAGDRYAFMPGGGISPAITFATPRSAAAKDAQEKDLYAGVMRETPLYQAEDRTDVLRTLQKGDLLTVLRFGPDLTRVTDGKHTGYVSSLHINLECGEWNIPLHEYTAAVSCPPQERLHLRETPWLDSGSLGKYYNGTQVIINGSAENGFLPVSVGGFQGYMKEEFLAVSGTAAYDSVVSGMPILRVTTPSGRLHLRSAQNTASQSLGLYADGTLVTLCGLTDEWAHVLVGGQIGFMLRKYLSDPPY